ncbi:cytochrome P450 [Saccharata proteae CBS 121410]|uniref:Cytochrome P450 n=1 Tax=Saccharata proteae CBS 121410 TaxID=1314787 RepID=A0A9P4I1Z5_9PEZI|nr:cytochrome P450 [Saccharata proteae CBS 121410]
MAPTMAIGALSVLESVLLSHYAPQYSVTDSFLGRAAILFSAQLCAFLTWSIIIYPNFFSPLRHLPMPKGNSLIMGHFGRIRKESTGAPQREWIETVPNDGLIRYRFAFNAERVMVTSPKALAEVLVTKNYTFVKPSQVRLGIARILGVGILLAEGDEHKRQRKLLMPAFSFRHVKDLYPVFWSKARESAIAMIASMENPSEDAEKPSDVLTVGSWASRATLDIIGVAGMGQDFHAIQDPNSELNATYRRIFSPSQMQRFLQILGILLPFSVLRRIPIKRNEDVEEAAKTIKKIARNLIQEKRSRLEKGGSAEHDIISVALESGGFSDEDLVNQLMTFLAAGHETTASSMMWAIYVLCQHPDIQQRLREEVHKNLPSIQDPNAEVTATDIDRMPYLNAVCNEVIRIYPPVPLTLRAAAEDTTICGHPIPKGTTVIIPPWAVNVSKELWGDDALEFKPERWIGPGRANTGGADSNYSFLTFLHGPRSCIGSGFARAEFACLLAAWVGRFEMELADPNYELQIAGGITAKPKDGLPVKMKVVQGW